MQSPRSLQPEYQGRSSDCRWQELAASATTTAAPNEYQARVRLSGLSCAKLRSEMYMRPIANSRCDEAERPLVEIDAEPRVGVRREPAEAEPWPARPRSSVVSGVRLPGSLGTPWVRKHQAHDGDDKRRNCPLHVVSAYEVVCQ